MLNKNQCVSYGKTTITDTNLYYMHFIYLKDNLIILCTKNNLLSKITGCSGGEGDEADRCRWQIKGGGGRESYKQTRWTLVHRGMRR